MDWCRWHNGTATDAKWRVVSRRAGLPSHMIVAVWAALIELANQGKVRGTIDNLDPEVIAAGLDMEPDQVETIVQAMQGKVLSGLQLTGWEKRNPKREREDSSRERVRKHRSDVTPGNANGGHVTPRNAAKRPERKKEREKEKAAARESDPLPNGNRLAAATESLIDELILAANRGMRANPAIGDACRPIPPGHGSRQFVADWITLGVPAELAEKVILDKARNWTRQGRERQISTMAYFDAAVREAIDMSRSRAALNGSNGDYHDGSPVVTLKPGEVFQ